MKKVFNKDGDSTLRFGANSKVQIIKWLDGIDYNYAIKYAKKVKDPVFGKALEFPCEIIFNF